MMRRKSCVRVVAAASLIAVTLTMIAGTLGERPTMGDEPFYGLRTASSSSESSTQPSPHLVATCLSGFSPFSVAYDPAHGYLYTSLSVSPPQISIIKSPCSLVKTITITSGSNIFGVAYDPVTKEIVAIDQGASRAYILQGTSLVKTVSLGSSDDGFCPEFPAWDSALEAMLISDQCRGGVDVLYLTEASGVTHAATILDAFDRGNSPTGILVADGYIFSAGNLIDVYNDRTLAYLGSFDLPASASYFPLAWDPLNHTVVMGAQNGYSSEDVFFLDEKSIATHKFTFHNLIAHNILEGGVGGIVYSPANENVYITAMGGDDVWSLSPTGVLSHLYLQPPIGMWNAVYDPANQDVYVCGFDMYVVS